ncbi:MAG: ribonuclease III domain-containing protein [Oscillospiraceae bacterium]
MTDSIAARMLNPLTLAFIGDGVYELLAREHIVACHGSLSPGKLHALCVEVVRASAQASAFSRIEGLLDEEELTIFRRGRNAGGVTVPKSSSTADYRCATGLEALFGYLHLCGRSERTRALFAEIIQEATI